jgi:hypothetical protein
VTIHCQTRYHMCACAEIWTVSWPNRSATRCPSLRAGRTFTESSDDSGDESPSSEYESEGESTQQCSSIKDKDKELDTSAADGQCPTRKRRKNPRFKDFVRINGAMVQEKIQKHLRALQILAVKTAVSVQPDERLLAEDVRIPRSIKEAMKDTRFAEYWRAAMDEEMESLRIHGIWVLVENTTPSGRTKVVITNR